MTSQYRLRLVHAFVLILGCVADLPIAHGQASAVAAAPGSAASQPAAKAGRTTRGRDEPPGEPEEEGTGPRGTRLTGESYYDVQPVVLSNTDGSNWVAWVGYLPGAGDFLFIGVEREGKVGQIQRVTSEPADLFRPVLVRSAGTSMLLWTQTLPGQGPAILYSTLEGSNWSAPKPIPGQAPHTLNPEAAAMPAGAIAVVYQVFDGHAYGIRLRTCKDGAWSEELAVAAPADGQTAPLDSWDPVAAFDSATGKLLIVWVSYFARDYDLCWATYHAGNLGPVSRIVHRGYDLHPCASADPAGGVWLAWDNITVPNHGSSGSTFIKHPQKRDVEGASPGLKCYVAAAKWSGGQVTVPDGDRVSGGKENTRHGGTPKLGWDDSKRLYIAYRSLHPTVSGRTLYFWDMNVRTLNGAKWSDPVRLAESDGPTEEASLVAGGPDSIRVFFQRDYRRTKSPNDGRQIPALPNEKWRVLFDHHADYGDAKLRHGDIFVTNVPGSGAGPKIDKPFEPDALAAAAYSSADRYRKGEYTVFFGDLHRHSNVSRCSRGAEPDPDDHYRYSRDVCRYDFLGISDHAAHTSDYNWWRLQKLADLYYTPGDFTTLFGVEWNGPEGHKNVMSPTRKIPLLATTGIAPNARALWDELAKSGVPAVTIPHTSSLPGQDTDWSKHDDRYERLVEIFQSGRGSFEGEGAPRLFSQAKLKGQHVQDALAKGYRLGIIASSDHGYGATYCCVYAKENTRGGVFDALYDRRCYASTTYGIIVDFNVNGIMMGRDVKRGEAVVLGGFVRGSTKLDKVQILKDNQVVQEWQPESSTHTLNWKDPSPETGLHWYYLRVIQDDDEMAWSSPAWVVD